MEKFPLFYRLCSEVIFQVTRKKAFSSKRGLLYGKGASQRGDGGGWGEGVRRSGSLLKIERGGSARRGGGVSTGNFEGGARPLYREQRPLCDESALKIKKPFEVKNRPRRFLGQP